MAFQPVANAYQLVLHSRLDGDADTVNVFGLLADAVGVLSQSETNALAGLFSTDYLPDITPYLTTGCHFDGITVTDLRTEGAPQFFSDTSFPISGTDATGTLPNEVSALIHWQTALRGSSFRGRTYVSGWALDTTNGNTMLSVPNAALQEMSEDMVAANIFGVISRRHNKVLRPTGIITPIQQSHAELEWKSQRGRRPTN